MVKTLGDNEADLSRYTYGERKSLVEKVKQLPADTWVPWNVQDGAELCVVHTASPHGLFSCGWNGTHKLIILDCCDGKAPPQLVIDKIMKVASELAESFNREFPDGLPDVEELDDEDDEDDE